MDDLDLPPLPNPQSALTPLTRKRTHPGYDANTSSDPALFSSDEQAPPSADNYASKRRKQQYKGTWWGDRSADLSTRRKRSLKRNFDSGVFMASDGTDTSLDEDFLEEQDKEDMLRSESIRSNLHSENAESVKKSSPQHLPERPGKKEVAPNHERAKVVVQKCLDDGMEDVDLSSLFLETLPADIASLKFLTKHAVICDPPTSQEAYSSIEAKLRLYLANNSLRNVPTALLELENLRLLSLRQNNLTQIPPGIRRLINLEKLNVSGNSLQYLPFEVMELIKFHRLRELIVDPNPWKKVGDFEFVDEKVIDQDLDSIGVSPFWLTRVAISEENMFLCNGTTQAASRVVPAASARGPYLTETVLRRLLKVIDVSSIDISLTQSLPPKVQDMLATAQDVQKSGGRRCTACHRDIVIPRTQWFEWWEFKIHGGSSSSVQRLPYLRQQCLVACRGQVNSWTSGI